MYLNYSKLEFDADGNPETPVLLLKTMSEETIGVIPGVHNLKLNIKFSEPSEMTFDLPAMLDGVPNWIYDQVTGYKVVYTKNYGVYVIMSPDTEADGISEIKHVQAYSIEKTLESKKFFLEEGTYKFYDQTNPYNTDTLYGRMLEIAIGWKPGYISPSIAQRYRTFDEHDDYLLSFIYNTVPGKYRCVFVFDPYERTISVYDADEKRNTLPIYLDFNNLLTSVDITELSDELVTALRPYGADGLDIRQVNPTGSNWIYDLSYFIENGDIPTALAEKWTSWQKTVLNQREHYRGLVALQASTIARLLAEQAVLTDLQGELETIQTQQSVAIQAIAEESTESGKETQEDLLEELHDKAEVKQAEIREQKELIASLQELLDSEEEGSYAAQIGGIVNALSLDNCFSEEERQTLAAFFIEQDLTEETFVSSDIDTEASGETYKLDNETLLLKDSEIHEIRLTDFEKTMYSMSGGVFEFSGDYDIHGDIIRGTLERSDDNRYVLSLYAGSITVNNVTAPSGIITMAGDLSEYSSDIKNITTDGISHKQGARIQFTAMGGSMFITANVSDYKKYSVQMELFDYAAEVLSDLATPTYEFSVDSGNFIFSSEFAPFRNQLELGRGVYLNIGHKQLITPYIIEFEVEFEERNKFAIIFSNRFKRHDNCNTLKDMIEQSYSSSRSFDASKYIYNQATNQASMVSQFMNSSLEAAKNTIIAAANQSVVINGAGIHIGGDSNDQLRIVNSMIAMSDDNWQTAKLAIGRFYSPEVGSYFGINAEVVGGRLIVGNNLIIENVNDEGVMQFKVDASGAWLNNATFVLQKDDGGKIILDPDYGIMAGNGSLFTTSGTTVLPSFIDEDGNIVFDDEGMPEGANFYLDISNGDAYFRGTLNATAGSIGGFTIAEDYLHTGSGGNYVALNGSGSNEYSAYAIWAGGENAVNAPFWVKKDGSIYAKNGTFSGTLYAAELSGVLVASSTGGWIEGCGIRVGESDSASQGYNFYVDTSGNVWIQGNLKLSSKSAISWDSLDSSVINMIENAYEAAYDAEDVAKSIAAGTYNVGGTTFISGKLLYSPNIIGGKICAASNSDSRYAVMQSEGFEIYIDGVDEPKARIITSENGETVVLRLGSGDDNNHSLFYIRKKDTYAELYYETIYGEKCGFRFDDDNTISLIDDTSTTISIPAAFA